MILRIYKESEGETMKTVGRHHNRQIVVGSEEVQPIAMAQHGGTRPRLLVWIGGSGLGLLGLGGRMIPRWGGGVTGEVGWWVDVILTHKKRVRVG